MRIGWTFAVVVAALALGACQPGVSGGAAHRTVLKIASQKGGTRSLMIAAHALDGAPYDVEWSEFPSAQALLEALAAGAVDAGAVGDAPFVFAYAAGDRIKAVQATRAAAGGSSTAVLVRADSAITGVAQLKGKRVATGRGSIGHYLLLRVLERAGLSPSDVTVVYLSPADSKAAFDSGSVDAWVTWGSYVALARLHDHARVIADGQGVLSGIGFEAASDGAIGAKRAALADFLHRLAGAQRWESTHTGDYAQVLASDTGLPPDVALYTVSRLRGVPAPIDAGIIDEERQTLRHFVEAGVIPKAPDLDAAFDTTFNAAAAP